MKGQVLRADDKRLRPHSPEHMAAIRLGMARAEWTRRQGTLAQNGEPHALVPMSEKVASLFNESDARRDHPRGTAIVGQCHWCYFWGTKGEHVDTDPAPTPVSY